VDKTELKPVAWRREPKPKSKMYPGETYQWFWNLPDKPEGEGWEPLYSHPPQPSETPDGTPVTDAAVFEVFITTAQIRKFVVDESVSRQLERELNAARAEVAQERYKNDELRKDKDSWQDCAEGWERYYRKLLSEVKEWECMRCKTVYPGPPQKGFMCLICPKCGGETVKRFSDAHNILRAEAAEQALAQVRGDAERYRWLRVHSTQPVEAWSTHSNPESLDAAIDAAMKEGE